MAASILPSSMLMIIFGFLLSEKTKNGAE